MTNEFGTTSKTTYDVECVWYDKEKKNEAFSKYYAHAFTDCRSPSSRNLLIHTQPEIFDRRIGDSLSFKTAEEAIKAAKFIGEFGHTTAGYAGTESWREKYRGPIKTRVVENHILSSRRIIEA